MAATKELISRISGATPWRRKLYRTAGDFWQDAESLHYAYVMYRTLRGDYARTFKPDAILYVGKFPAAYVKTVTAEIVSEQDIRVWQRFLWNQSVVPLLIVKSRSEIRVYTAFTEPRDRDSPDRIQPILESVADAIELDQLYTAIEAGTIYETEPRAFNRSKAVDHYLVKNLNGAARRLAEAQSGGITPANLEFAHQFLTRLLFTCYLIERGMVRGKHFDDPLLRKFEPASERSDGYSLCHLFSELKTTAEKRNALYQIFSYVRTRFNGSLFAEGMASERARINDSCIAIVDYFLHGHDFGTGQPMLGFWAYDFRVIPIETISAVYQSFLGAQGEVEELSEDVDSHRSSGAYYTPPHLADLTVDIVLEGTEKPLHDLKVLDPACGSGVFLVTLFARMAKSLRRVRNHLNEGPSIDWARRLIKLLDRLYALDVNSTACHITCFSLYLALLEELSPMDVEYLHDHGERLPPLRADGSRDSLNTIHHENFFDPGSSFAEREFDIVVGNPPWVSRGNQKDAHFLEWQKEDPEVRGPEKQIAHGFMWRAGEYLHPSGVACFLLPATVLLNSHTNRFQAEWFQSVTVERIVNLSDLRFVLFPGAIHPCVGIRFRPTPPHPESKIPYEVPKVDRRSQQGGRVYVREEDITNIRTGDILDAAKKDSAPVIWKSHFWGTWRDLRLVARLDDLPKLKTYVGTAKGSKRFMKGQGFQPFNPKPNSDVAKIQEKKKPEKPWWTPDMLYLRARNVQDLVVVPEDCERIGDRFQSILFPRDPRLFEGPKVLTSQGSRDMKVAFCNHQVVFQDALQTITGKKKDADLLRFLTAVIKSGVAQYYLFHTAANWGTERDKVHFHELLRLPFFLPEDGASPDVARNIIQEASRAIQDFENRLRSDDWMDRQAEATRIRRDVLDPLVRAYYDIDKYEAMVIEDTLHLAKESLTPGENTRDIPTLREAREGDCRVYAETLRDMLDSFGQTSNFRVRCGVLLGAPYSIVHVRLINRTSSGVCISRSRQELGATLQRMETILENQNGQFVFCQNLKVFDGDSLYILKPVQMRFWSRTAALNDADEIAGAIINWRGSH
jgi:hypothetical protein